VRRSLVLLQRSNVLQPGQARLVFVSAKKTFGALRRFGSSGGRSARS
jgi:hypothetical protein